MSDVSSGNEAGPELHIGRLSSDQVNEAGRILAQAFLDEKMFSYLLCDDRDKRLHATIPVFQALVRAHLPYGGVHRAMLGDKLVGVAVRLPPEHDPLRGRESLRFNLRIMPSMLRLLTRCRGARNLIRIISELDSIKPKDKPYWYMITIGIEPEYQGQGIGGRLTQDPLDQADAWRAHDVDDVAGSEATIRAARLTSATSTGAGAPRLTSG